MSPAGLKEAVPYVSEHLSCETECVAGVLVYHGLGPLCVLYGKDWGFFHYITPGPGGGDLLLASWRRPEEEFWAEHRIRLTVRLRRDRGRAWRGVRAVLDRGRPVVVLVDPCYLPRSTGYGVRHSLHFIIVNGYDLRRRQAFVADALHRYRGPLPLEVLAQARGGGGDGVQPANKWIEVEPPQGPPPALEVLVARALGRNLRAMLGRRPPALSRRVRRILEGQGAVRAGCGLAGLRAFARQLVERPPEPEGFQSLYRQFIALGEKRAWQGQFLAHAGQVLGLRPLLEAGRGLEPVAESWMVARNLMFKAARAGPDAQMPRRIQKRLLDIADAEERLLGLVADARRGLVGGGGGEAGGAPPEAGQGGDGR